MTESSAYDADIVDKSEQYVASGNKAIVTSGFVKATLDKGLARITSIRNRSRKTTVKEFCVEASRFYNRWERAYGEKPVNIPVLEFRNNSTWGAVCKGICEEEADTVFALDTYGDGQMYTLVVPESFSDLKYYPNVVRNRMRKEFAVNGVYLTGDAMICLFVYDNDDTVFCLRATVGKFVGYQINRA